MYYLNEITPLTLQLNVKYSPSVHNYSTRQAKTRLSRHKLRSIYSSVLVKGPEVWNAF